MWRIWVTIVGSKCVQYIYLYFKKKKFNSSDIPLFPFKIVLDFNFMIVVLFKISSHEHWTHYLCCHSAVNSLVVNMYVIVLFLSYLSLFCQENSLTALPVSLVTIINCFHRHIHLMVKKNGFVQRLQRFEVARNTKQPLRSLIHSANILWTKQRQTLSSHILLSLSYVHVESTICIYTCKIISFWKTPL